MTELEPQEMRQISSAQDVARAYKKKEKEQILKRQTRNQDLTLTNKQIELLQEANLFARQEAQQAKAESSQAIRSARYSNIIATASFVLAVASLVYTIVTTST